MIRRPARSTLCPCATLFRSFSYQLRVTAPGGHYVPFTENPAQWAYSLLLPWITLAFLFSAQHARLTRDRKSTRLNSSHANISYAVFCLQQKCSLRSRRRWHG